ncbi:mannose-6-phosphate isomerase [Salipaludibacillus neizhouensis]|uniref:Mannose-6-phosphate isomerase n=1 Tax=Salipaludibacillus neizhouensis TaxID=885475 RepID=A0A3A9JXS7_9BACI|nr:class I mannose-6-phosphate isomerase [Salipaludibacillus neizhouensis]RKL65009.1 mannose-6-phosphate isomerase [Salipaludibacillus neizhouensis]
MYNKRPLNPVRSTQLNATIKYGYEEIVSLLNSLSLSNKQTVILDGTHGVNFKPLINEILLHFNQEEITLLSTYDFLKSEEEIREFFDKNITDNRAFGYVTEVEIDTYFEEDARETLQTFLGQQSDTKKMCIVWGPGASYLHSKDIDISLFLDVTRESQEIKHKESLMNFGFQTNIDAVEKFKISYFVEWPILENYRKRNLSQFDYYVDLNDQNEPKLVTITDFLAIIRDISNFPLRVKPFFMPGVWGGQYLKKMADLPNDMTNCAWNFEPIAPENSILVENKGETMEIPFLLVMANANNAILGDRIVGLFGDYFPVRLNFLDTIEGDNLSCQVHPKESFLREAFNEKLEQQESYYIVETKGNPKVYLGFTEDVNIKEFKETVEMSQKTGEAIPFTDYIQEWESKKGNLYHIPSGTVHCAGKNNLVLEISSTTWWFTFKIYDYVRKDLDGKPRPINTDYGFANVDSYKDKPWVENNLLPKPKMINKQGSNEEYDLGKRDDLLFFVNRIHLDTQWIDNTNGEFLLFNLVEGDKVRIISLKDTSVFVDINYGESYILPAVFGAFQLENNGEVPCKLIKAGVSPNWDVKMTDD